MSSISQRIRYYRSKRGMTQSQVAAALGIRTDNYSKYESGVRVPRSDRLASLAEILGISYDALSEGIERKLADLLNWHAVCSVLGDVACFAAFSSDMETSGEAYRVIAEFLDKGEQKFAAHGGSLYTKYIENPTIPTLVAFFDMYLSSDNSAAVSSLKEPDPVFEGLDISDLTKWIFCVAVRNYLNNNDTESILKEAETLSKDFEPLQVFAVKVFVPYLSFIIDTVEFCMNTNIDDFEIAFLHGALTPHGELCDADFDDEDDVD